MLKDSLRNGDVIAGAVLAALGAYILVASRDWGYFGEDGPGPSFFPAIYGGAMLVLSLALIAIALRSGERQEYDWTAIRRALVVWGAFAASVALMPWIGFLISFALLAFFMSVFIFGERPQVSGMIAVGSAAAFYLVFPLALGVELPTGIFGF